MNTPPSPRGRPKSFNSKQSQNTIQSLDRAISVLEYLSLRGGQTLTQIATSMDQSPATIYRVLSTFEARGLVVTDSTSQTWSVGPMTFRIGSAFLRRTSVIERARPFMRQLMDQTGETANLGIQSGANVMFISQVETHHSIRAFFPPGTVAPMHASGIGKALLSRLNKEEVKRLLDAERLTPFTSNTFDDLDSLLTNLAVCRERGFALDDEEKTEGMRCIAAPVSNIHGEVVAGISVSGPTNRICDTKVEQYGELIKHAADELSAALGSFTTETE